MWGVAAGAAALWVALLLVKAKKLSEWRGELMAVGFPRDYATALAELKYEHPQWRFEPLPIGDIEWNAAVDRECAPGWNLVVSSAWAPSKWKPLGVANYTPYYAANAKSYDSGAWYQASREAIAFFMDPRNFLNEYDVFMFETLQFDAAAQKRSVVERVLAVTFMANAGFDGGERKFSELLMEIGERYGVSPVFLAGRLTSEQGTGSVQASGRIGDSLMELATNSVGKIGRHSVWGSRYAYGGSNTQAVVKRGAAAYNGYYNFFNIGACGDGLFEIRYNAWREASSKEVAAKYCGPWTSQKRAIEGGSKKVCERYIETFRHTRYLQKFSVDPRAGEFRWKQYMQNIAAPLVEARIVATAYRDNREHDLPFHFVIPVYAGMPPSPCADPAKGKSVYSPTRD